MEGRRPATRGNGRAVLLALLTLAASACSRAPTEADQRAVLVTYQRIAHAAYADARGGAQRLLDSAQRLVREPGAANLDAAREAWRAARVPYAQTETYRFGNWVVDAWETRVNGWPLDEGLLDYVAPGSAPAQDSELALANLIGSGRLRFLGRDVDADHLSAGLLAQLQTLSPVETALFTGYHAIEFLLWGQDLRDDGPGARPWTDYAQDEARCSNGSVLAGDAAPCRRRGEALVAMAQLLVRDLQEMERHWAPDAGSYGTRLATGAVDDGLRRLLFGMATFAAEELAGERLRVALMTHAQEEEQDCFSDDTHRSHAGNAQGLANLYQGRYRRGDGSVVSGPSLRDLLRRLDGGLVGQLDAAVAQTRATMRALVDAAERDGQSFDRLIAPGHVRGAALIGAAIDALDAQAALLQRAARQLRLEPLNPAALPGARPAPGGATTLRKRDPDVTLDRDAFSQPAANLAPAERARFAVGNAFFTTAWVAAPSTTAARDGLGPLFNAAACQHCHIRDGRGHPPAGPEDDAQSALLRLARPGGVPDPVYGTQLQDRAIAGVAPEGRVRLAWQTRSETLADGTVVELRSPRLGVDALAYGPLHAQTALSLRVAPPMIGLGLLESIAAEAIERAADPGDRDGDGISGRARRVDGGLGRFGWKAAQPTVRAQAIAAFANDLGITLDEPLAPCTAAQDICGQAPNGGVPELAADILDAVTFYARHLAVPARRWQDVDAVRAGEGTFTAIGCAACHRPSWRTALVSDAPALSRQDIAPYTDLLLHDLGPALADGVAERGAAASEWRTAPLWGLHLTRAVSGPEAGFLHDGRARTLEEAILWHGGEASRAREAFRVLPRAEREALIWFLKSL